MPNPNVEKQLETLLTVLEEAGAGVFVQDAAERLNVRDCYDLKRRLERIEKAAQEIEAASRSPAESLTRAPAPAAKKRKA